MNTTVPSCPLKPLEDRIIVYPDAAAKVTDGGIIIPDTAQERPASGIVVAVGPGFIGKPTTLQIGDRVTFSRMTGNDLLWEDNKYLLMRESEISCTI